MKVFVILMCNLIVIISLYFQVFLFALLAVASATGFAIPSSLSYHNGWSADFPLIGSLIIDHKPVASVVPQRLITTHGPLAVRHGWNLARAFGQDVNAWTHDTPVIGL